MPRSAFQDLLIGSLKIAGNVFAAPMAGYTDRVTRALALKAGACLAYTEMISSEGLVRNDPRSLAMMRRAEGEQILAVQLFGSSSENLGRAACIAAESGADLLDLNAGCPVRKVTSRGGGAALAQNRNELVHCIMEMRKSGLPVTVKMRMGWDRDDSSWKDTALAAADAGASAIAFHPRTREQGYGGRADWDALGEMAVLVRVPVIGSGDLETPDSCLDMLRSTSCAAVMIARGAIGDPDIFHRTITLITENRCLPPPSVSLRIDGALNHLVQAMNEFGPEAASREMKKHLARYVRGWPGSAELRQALMRAPDCERLMILMKNPIVLSPDTFPQDH
jgi:nifR3 family TIM-barrel protein